MIKLFVFFVLFYIVACDVQLFKVSYGESPFGTAVKAVTSGSASYVYNAAFDVFATRLDTDELCIEAVCCNVNTMYVSSPAEYDNLLMLETMYDTSIDRLMLYHYLCAGTRKSLDTETDVESANLAVEAMMQNDADWASFSAWLTTLTIQ
jgi:hypothetical protein